jgi:hypothetical protein
MPTERHYTHTVPFTYELPEKVAQQPSEFGYLILGVKGKAIALMVEKNAYRDFLGKPVDKRLVGKPKRRWEDNIKMDIREIRWGMD